MNMTIMRLFFASAAMVVLAHTPSHAADCWAIGQQYAAENNGTLTKANLTNRDGKAMCDLVVLVPGQDGERPKRLAKTVNAG